MYKPCFVCGVPKPLEDYYRHPETADGRLHLCKDCHRARMKVRRLTNPKVQEYDRARKHRPERVVLRKKLEDRWSKQHPLAVKAHRAVQYAVQTGRLMKTPCALCGQTEHLHAHHRDYAKPLDVVWLCAKCHHRLHATFPELGGHAEVSP